MALVTKGAPILKKPPTTCQRTAAEIYWKRCHTGMNWDNNGSSTTKSYIATSLSNFWRSVGYAKSNTARKLAQVPLFLTSQANSILGRSQERLKIRCKT